MSRRPTTRAELQLLGYTPMQLLAAEQGSITLLGQTHADIQLMGATESAALHAALKNLARKIPSADPGPQPNWNTESGVSDRMIQALAATLLALNGIPSKFRVTASKYGGGWSHIYVVAGLPKEHPTKWVAVDTTLPGRFYGTEASYAMKKDFNALAFVKEAVT